MKNKRKYVVYCNGHSVKAVYITTTKTCEYMIQEIRRLHESYSKTQYLRIVRFIGEQKETIYTSSKANKIKFGTLNN